MQGWHYYYISCSEERRKNFYFRCKYKSRSQNSSDNLSSGWVQPQLALVNPKGQLTKINLPPFNIIKQKHLPDLSCWQLLVLGSHIQQFLIIVLNKTNTQISILQGLNPSAQYHHLSLPSCDLFHLPKAPIEVVGSYGISSQLMWMPCPSHTGSQHI